MNLNKQARLDKMKVALAHDLEAPEMICKRAGVSLGMGIGFCHCW